MIYAEPDFYGRFQCTADKCRHSCCIGWEIDIDEDTAEYYASLDGAVGEELSKNISRDPTAHFIPDKDERCPFLNERGLCRLILTLGEESLCDICTEHPRFYNEFPERLERGLGLCCEEAVRLLLDESGPLRIITAQEDGGESETPEIIKRRERIFEILSDRSVPLTKRTDSACLNMGTAPVCFDAGHWRKFYMTLERMDDEWTRLLESAPTGEIPERSEYERLAEYLVYRHFSAAETEENAADMLRFCFLSVYFIASLPGALSERIRLYSAEIEYSDENIPLIVGELERLNKLRGGE